MSTQGVQSRAMNSGCPTTVSLKALAERAVAVAVVAHAREELARGLTFRSASTR
jgi:hypothetical protein